MAANLLPIIAIAGAAYFLMKKKGEPSTNGNGEHVPPECPRYVVVPLQDKPRTFGLIGPDDVCNFFRFEAGGDISEWTIDGPEGSSIEADIVRKGGVGNTTVDLQIKKVGMWHVTTTAKGAEGSPDIHREWDLDIRVLHTGAMDPG